MRELDALEALGRLTVAGTRDRVGALSDASAIVGAVIGSGDVRLFAGDGVTYEGYPPREDEDFFGLSPVGLLSASTELRKLAGPGGYTIDANGLPRDGAPADAR